MIRIVESLCCEVSQARVLDIRQILCLRIFPLSQFNLKSSELVGHVFLYLRIYHPQYFFSIQFKENVRSSIITIIIIILL